MRIETALLSVSDKTGIVELASALVEQGVKILSTGGTAKQLKENGIAVVPVSDHTGFPEILDGRVKTLHPRVHGGILARFDDPEHRKTLSEHSIPPIGLVAVNLYPFEETVSRPGVSMAQAVEQIDIGGPTLIRAAAKNHAHVTVVVDPDDYESVVEALKDGSGGTEELRSKLALKAFRHCADYDWAIAGFLAGEAGAGELPDSIDLRLVREKGLRYGENPHQRAALYRPASDPLGGLVGAEQLQGKQLSFNNYLDLEAAWDLCGEFETNAAVIIKHNNPCGAAMGESPQEAFDRALACDRVSAFGSIVAFNRQVDAAAARSVTSIFVEAVIAPSFDPEALEVLSAKKKLRVMQASMLVPALNELDSKKISGGYLFQDADSHLVGVDGLKTVTRREPDEGEWNDLLFAWKVSKHVKSNAIVFARQGRTLGIGAGQMSRVDSVILASRKAESPTRGAVMAGDAFFPFRDGIDEAAKAGIRAVIQPGGSRKDKEVIEAADEHGMTMVLTGMRHFRH